MKKCKLSSQNGKKTELDSYLIDITTDILGYKDADGEPLVEKNLRYRWPKRDW